MKKLIWRKIVIPGFILISVIILLSIVKNKGDFEEGLDGLEEEKVIQLSNSEELNRKRIILIEEICKKYSLGIHKASNLTPQFKYPPTPQYSVFYFDNAHNIAYCPSYKAGSTTWLYNLLTLNGVKEDQIKKKQISEVARESFPQIDGELAEIKFSQFQSLLCVRHPFDRILSAYRDKLEDKNRAPQHGTFHYFKKWGSKIRNKYRNYGKLEPTFEEFVRYLIDTNLLLYADDHWIPYNAYCTPCLLRYNYVGKVETLTDDQKYIFHSLNLPSWLVPTRRHSSKNASSQVAKEYYSQITKMQIRKLYDKFRLDFEMFEYSIHPFLGYAKD